MEKNKSIDGLAPRRAKKTANSTAITKKPVVKKSTANTKITSRDWDSICAGNDNCNKKCR